MMCPPRSAAAIPADSCPRCWSAYSAKYDSRETSWPGANMPNTPHSSRGPSRSSNSSPAALAQAIAVFTLAGKGAPRPRWDGETDRECPRPSACSWNERFQGRAWYVCGRAGGRSSDQDRERTVRLFQLVERRLDQLSIDRDPQRIAANGADDARVGAPAQRADAVGCAADEEAAGSLAEEGNERIAVAGCLQAHVRPNAPRGAAL